VRWQRRQWFRRCWTSSSSLTRVRSLRFMRRLTTNIPRLQVSVAIKCSSSRNNDQLINLIIIIITREHLVKCVCLSKIAMLYSGIAVTLTGPWLWNNLLVELRQRNIAFGHFKWLAYWIRFRSFDAAAHYDFCSDCAICKHTCYYSLTYLELYLPPGQLHVEMVYTFLPTATHPITNRPGIE